MSFYDIDDAVSLLRDIRDLLQELVERNRPTTHYFTIQSEPLVVSLDDQVSKKETSWPTALATG